MSALTQNVFTTPTSEAIFSASTELKSMLTFESALAQVQAELGLIPVSAARVISEVCQQTDWDQERIQAHTLLAGNPAIPLVKALMQRVQQLDPEAAKYVHWGATSQDVIDTAFMLQAKAALADLISAATQLEASLAKLAQQHRQTLMIGRTLLQQARPITFGYKVAGWLAQLSRSVQKIRILQQDGLPLQLGGAVGTLVAMPQQGIAVTHQLAIRLGLSQLPMPWHTQRDPVAELATSLGILNGTLGKIANDCILLMQTEVGEVYEGAAEGKGGSSAMPHKRNPVSSTFMVAIAHRTPALVSTVLSAMVQQHDRAAGNWHIEWEVMRELFKLSAANLRHANDLIGGLEVDTSRMQQNIELTKGLIFAEDVTNALAPIIGKSQAQQWIEQACKQALLQQVSLLAYLKTHTEVPQYLSGAALENIFDPLNAIGLSEGFIDEVLKNYNNNLPQYTVK